MKYVPTIFFCIGVWVTIIVARTDSGNPLSMERIFAIGAVAICWLIIGICVHKIHIEKDW